MTIPLPPGYLGLQPLDRSAHGGLGINVQRREQFLAQRHFAPLLADELTRACLSYPIVFVESQGARLPCALFSLQEADNRFYQTDRGWQPGCYIPIYMRRFPLASLSTQDQGSREVVCVEPQALSDAATPLWGQSDGEESTEWRTLRELTQAFSQGLPTTRRLGCLLNDWGLLTPAALQGQHPDGQPIAVQGLWRVDETRLKRLQATQFRWLGEQGLLGRIYAHLISLENLPRLLQ